MGATIGVVAGVTGGVTGGVTEGVTESAGPVVAMGGPAPVVPDCSADVLDDVPAADDIKDVGEVSSCSAVMPVMVTRVLSQNMLAGAPPMTFGVSGAPS